MESPSPSEIGNCVAQSIKSANSEYEKLSRGEWISERGVESYVAYFVANGLKNLLARAGDYAVLLEVSVGELEDHYINSATIRGRRGNHRYKGNRIDVVVIKKIGDEWSAIGIVELKRDEFFGNWASDVRRVSYLLRTYGRPNQLSWGCFAGFVCEKEDDQWIQKTWEKEWKKFLQVEAKEVDCYLIEPDSSQPKHFEKYEEAESTEKWRYDVVGCVYHLKQ